MDPSTPPESTPLPTPISSGSHTKRNAMADHEDVKPSIAAPAEDQDVTMAERADKMDTAADPDANGRAVDREGDEEGPDSEDTKMPDSSSPQTTALDDKAVVTEDLAVKTAGEELVGLGLVEETAAAKEVVREKKKRPEHKQEWKEYKQYDEDKLESMSEMERKEVLGNALTTIKEMNTAIVEYDNLLTHCELQNQLLTIQNNEAQQRFEVENSIIKREVDRLRYENNGGLNESAEIYRRRLRKAKTKLKDVERSHAEKMGEIDKLKRRIRDSRNTRESLEQAAVTAQQHYAQHQQHQAMAAAYHHHWQQVQQHAAHQAHYQQQGVAAPQFMHPYQQAADQQQQYDPQTQYQLQQHYYQQQQQYYIQQHQAAAQHAAAQQQQQQQQQPQQQTEQTQQTKPASESGSAANTPQFQQPRPVDASNSTPDAEKTNGHQEPQSQKEEVGLAALGLLASQELERRESPEKTPGAAPTAATETETAIATGTVAEVDDKAALASPVDFHEPAKPHPTSAASTALLAQAARASTADQKRRRESSASTISINSDDDEHQTEDEAETKSSKVK